MSDHDRGKVWQDENGKLASFCPCCKKHHADADSDPAITALMEALDLLAVAVAGVPAKTGEEKYCGYCGAWAWSQIQHRIDCKAALFLRKHGRKVKIQGDPS
jgi:hypothetical protein